MSNALESSVLEGRAFGQHVDDGSPRQRASSPPSPTTSEELALSSEDNNCAAMDSAAHTKTLEHDGPQTGVKGVRADARHAAQIERGQRDEAVRNINARMESSALGKSRTWEQDEEEHRAEAEAGVKPGRSVAASRLADSDDEELAAIRRQRLQNIKSQAASNENRRKRLAGEAEGSVGGVNLTRARGNSAFGHLREVTRDQYPNAIDGEGPSTYVVVHIYVRNVHACAMLTSALSSLARIYSKTKFIQVRAGSIGFGGSGSANAGCTQNCSSDPNTDSERNAQEEAEADESAEDVVPTLLIYRAGKVVANLVRVDLEPVWGDGSERSITELLASYGALQ